MLTVTKKVQRESQTIREGGEREKERERDIEERERERERRER